jgi:uncharacterized protein
VLYLWIAVILLVSDGILIGIPWYLMRKVTHPRIWSSADAEASERESGLLGPYDTSMREPFIVTCEDGYLLHGEIFPCQGSDRFVVLTHGFSFTRHGSIKYIWMFLEQGYNVVIYDLRHHGENERYHVTMGYQESKDLVQLVLWLRTKYGQTITIGLHGESLGASTSLMALKKFTEKNIPIEFCIADCGYSNLMDLLAYKLKVQYPFMPRLMLDLANKMCGLRYGFLFSDVLPIKDVKESTTPILYIHGEADVFTPPRMSKEMFDASQGKRGLYMVVGADHAKSFSTDPEAYKHTVRTFISESIGDCHT